MDEFLEDFEDDSEIEEMIQEIEDSDMKQSLDQYFTMALEMSACAALALFSLHCREVKRWLLRRELLQKCRNYRKRFSPVQIRINGLLETVQLVKPEKSELKSTNIFLLLLSAFSLTNPKIAQSFEHHHCVPARDLVWHCLQ